MTSQVRTLSALLTLGLWMVATYGVPMMHQVGHRADHIHLPGGGVLFSQAHEHEEPDYSKYDRYFDDDFEWDEEPEEDDEDAPPSAPQDSAPAAPWAHGAGSLGHGGLIALSARKVLSLAAPLEEEVFSPWIRYSLDAPAMVRVSTLRARAPPCA